MTKRFGFWFAILFFALACISMTLYFMKKDKAVYSNEMITAISSSFKSDLKSFLSTAEESVIQLKKDAKNVDVDQIAADSLDFKIY